MTMVRDEARHTKQHAVVIPYPLQGHIIPTVQLALKLAGRGFAVTVVNTEDVHDKTVRSLGIPNNNSAADDRHDIFLVARESGLDIRYELVSDGLPVSFDRSLYPDEFVSSVVHLMPAHVDELLGRIIVDPAVTCLIADTFFVWPATLAKKHGVPYASFWTEPALILNLYYHIELLTKNGHFACKENRKDTITYVPGVQAIEPSELMSYLQDKDTTTVVHQMIYKAFGEAKRAADFVLCNTVEELEASTIAALRSFQPFYSIGPIFPAGFTRSSVATSLWTESDCSQWLDKKPPGSVLYISFGSHAHITKNDLKEIAHGVMASNVNFIWVLRPYIVSSDDPDPLPTGFLESTAGRGMVVTWCCQLDVLSHHAVGGFLTHCGWNSILESLWAGLPILCFPLLTDQFTNRKLVVKDWRVGVAIGELGAVEAEVVKRKIEELMAGKKGVEVREEVKKVRKALETALAPGGSSQRNLDQFVQDLMSRRH